MKKPPRDQHTAEVGVRLRHAIKATHGSLKRWGEKYGVTPGAINHWVHGWNYPDLPPLIEWCDDTGMTLDYVFRGRRDAVSEVLAEVLKRPKSALSAASQEPAHQARDDAKIPL